jgi:hypothetical protein
MGFKGLDGYVKIDIQLVQCYAPSMTGTVRRRLLAKHGFQWSVERVPPALFEMHLHEKLWIVRERLGIRDRNGNHDRDDESA